MRLTIENKPKTYSELEKMIQDAAEIAIPKKRDPKGNKKVTPWWDLECEELLEKEGSFEEARPRVLHGKLPDNKRVHSKNQAEIQDEKKGQLPKVLCTAKSKHGGRRNMEND